MNKEISRRGFVRDALGAAAAFAGMPGMGVAKIKDATGTTDGYYRQLVKANDANLPSVIDSAKGSHERFGVRAVGEEIDALAGAYCAPESAYFKSQDLLAVIDAAAAKLLAAQHPDGTIDSGNLCSPPDTGFVVQTVCTALTVLKHMNLPQLFSINQKLEKFLLAAGEALSTGGIHTPNHRWVVSSALAQLNALFPSAKYVDRIDDWLGEGIFCDADGQFCERSTGIYSRVVDNALITIARLLHRPELLEPVRRNLTMTIFYMHPNGELETVGSRRQDQTMMAWISNYYLQYRYMAIHDQNRQFAAVARFAEQIGLDQAEVKIPLIEFLEEPLYQRNLPDPEPLPSNYARFFSNSSLARIRRGETSATVYGGSDWPLGVASGLASNPAFFNFRKGKAVLESVRMTPTFFSEGAFRSEGMTVEENRYLLHQEVHVPYYQPLPKQLRNAKGDYPLTPAGNRFWSKMNFPQRPMSNIQTLEQNVTVTENAGAFELAFDVGGHDRVPVAIELTFRQGGELEGVEPGAARPNLSLLRQGTGHFRVGNDTITFGPGQADHEMIRMEAIVPAGHEGASPSGHRVYITGFTPFRKTLTIA
ncbi:MAG TPA: hypothetical protein VHD85_17425 [Terracidiphilus sp.]|nr:hypothetical protein [Terracidiphilus sp.]